MQVDSNIGADYEETITITPNKKQPTPESLRSTELCDLYYKDYLLLLYLLLYLLNPFY